MALQSMFSHSFGFDNARLRSAFAPRKPRHPLLRMAFGLIGLVLLTLLLLFGVFIGAAMIAGGLLYRLWKQRGKPVAARVARERSVVDGEYRVLGKTG